MSGRQPHIHRSGRGSGGVLIRLDGVDQPFGACPSAIEAASQAAFAPTFHSGESLRMRIAQTFRVSAGNIVLWPGINDAIRAIAAPQFDQMVTFPPSSLPSVLERSRSGLSSLAVNRCVGRQTTIDAAVASDLPPDSVAFLDSPSALLGSVISAAEAVRLARACRLVVVDERFAEFSGRSLLHLVSEFDNILILRTFETWAGLARFPCAWAAGAARALELAGLQGSLPEPAAIAAAVATLDDLPSVEATLKLVREERSRLMRNLRKFSFLEPLPSWGSFVAARVGLIQRDELVASLLARGIAVYAPPQDGLERYIRVGIGSRRQMDALQRALLDVAPEIAA